MRKPFLAVLILSLLFLLHSSWPVSAEDTHAASNGAENSAVADGGRGAGYLPYSDPTPLGSGGLFGAIVRTIFSLAVVIGLLYATLWMIKKLTGGTAGPYSQGVVRVVGRIHLSPKVVVYFLRIVDQLLVVGTNAGDVSLLMTIIDEHEIAQIEDALKGAYKSGSGSTFSRLFDKSMAKFQKTLEREDSIFDDQLRSLNEQIGRLRGLARKKEKHDE